MKTIGTITFHKTENYGAILQACALQKILSGMGHDSEIIDYYDPLMRISLLSRFRKVRYFVWHSIVRKLLVGVGRKRKTEEFCRKFLRLSTKKYLCSEKLHVDPPIYDVYIAGSDQIWSPNIINNDPSYFLTFAPSDKKRISYAASFGISQIPGEFVDDYRERLNKIHALSTRELEGRKIIERLTGRNAEVTLDPTLLLDQNQWSQIAVPYESSRPYILCYYMPGEITVNKSITSLARQVSVLTGWRIICIGQKEYMKLNPLYHSIFDAGPAEYLGLFQNASFVITNSFHGTAFSINYRKPFLVPIDKNIPPEEALTSRITTLLSTLTLEHRLIPVGESLPLDDILSLDYRAAEIILQHEKKKSISFLTDALKE
jgi:hypothetical protein